ncbi:MAG TPA: exodeoxyribonuclease VII large subunit [Longimicrobiales bacterium]
MSFDRESMRGRAASPDAARPLTVSALNAFAKSVLESRVPPVWVLGEVTDWKIASTGHCYFTLTDKRSVVRCVMFARDAERLPMHPAKGMQVRVYGHLTLFEQQGAYQLQVQSLEAESEGGLWKIRFEKVRKKLEEEGLLAQARKQSLPRFPMTVGVVTSPVGAALHDVLNVIRRRAPWTRVVLAPAKVQGDGAARDVVRAMRALYKLGGIDVMIVCRGGGSAEDLWTFNEEEVARAIAKCPIPVVTGIGHEVDVTIADLAADLRAATPSVAAETVVQDRAGLDREFGVMRNRMANATRRRVKQAGGRLESAQRDLLYEMRAALRRRQDRLARAAGKLEALSPLSALARGYSVALDDAGRVLRNVADFAERGGFALRVLDGRVDCSVEGIEKQEMP